MTPTRTRLRRLVAVVAGCSAIGLILSGCGATAGGNDAGAAKFTLSASTPKPSKEIDTFSWALYAEPFSLDYAYAFDYPDNQVLANMCESLFRWNPDLSSSPGLATKFEHPDDLTWVYTIRQGVHFHDGSLMTADDVVASLKRHVDDKVGSFWVSAFARVAEIRKTGDYEVTITTSVPDYSLNSALVGAPGVVESAKTLTQDGKDYGNAATGVNCTGPFQFDHWDAGESITLKRFDDYWDPNLKPKTKEMTFKILPDANARVNALQTGEIDGSWGVPPNALDVLKANTDAGNVYFGNSTSVTSLITSNFNGVFGDLRVRKALMMAINRDALVQAAAQGYGKKTDALTTRNVWVDAQPSTVNSAFESLEKQDYNLDEARRLIKEAGATGKKFVYATAPISAASDITSRAVASAAEQIGLVPEIQTMSNSKYTTLFSDPAARKGIDLFETSWYLSSADPTEMYSVLRTGEFSNYGGWSNADFDQLVNNAIGTKSVDERDRLTAQAAKIASQDVVWSPLYENVTSLWLGKRITGAAPSINYMYYPWAATIGGR